MSQHISHRRGGTRHQDNGPRWESHTPNAGCNSTHVARARRGWRDLDRRSRRRRTRAELRGLRPEKENSNGTAP